MARRTGEASQGRAQWTTPFRSDWNSRAIRWVYAAVPAAAKRDPLAAVALRVPRQGNWEQRAVFAARRTDLK
jgi:hypothetical protein